MMKNKELLMFLIIVCAAAGLTLFIYGDQKLKKYAIVFAFSAAYFFYNFFMTDDPTGMKSVKDEGKAADLGQNGGFSKEDLRERAISAINMAAKRDSNMSFMISYRFMLRIEEGIKVPRLFELKGIDFERILVITKPQARRDYYELYMEGSGTAGGRREGFKVMAIVIECDGSLYLDDIIPEIPKDRMKEIKAAVAV